MAQQAGKSMAVHMSYVELHLDNFVDLLDQDNQPDAAPRGKTSNQMPPTTPRKNRIEIREQGWCADCAQDSNLLQ
jgi:hypothetical protein